MSQLKTYNNKKNPTFVGTTNHKPKRNKKKDRQIHSFHDFVLNITLSITNNENHKHNELLSEQTVDFIWSILNLNYLIYLIKIKT